MRRMAHRIGVVATLLVALALPTTALALPVISHVGFTGTPTTTTVTVTGTGFGKAPKSFSAATTSCGTYVANGRWYGKYGLWFFDNTHQWQAGKGTSAGGNCIGIVVQSWSATQVVFQFGNAYASFDHWTADPGDNFVISLKAAFWGGLVSY